MVVPGIFTAAVKCRWGLRDRRIGYGGAVHVNHSDVLALGVHPRVRGRRVNGERLAVCCSLSTVQGNSIDQVRMDVASGS